MKAPDRTAPRSDDDASGPGDDAPRTARAPRGRAVTVLLPAILALCGALLAPAAQAGLLDQINSAAKALGQKAKQAVANPASSGGDADHPLTLQGEGHCHGQNTATCLDYMEVDAQCLAPLHGYRMKLLADRIAIRLQTATLEPQQRKNLEEDMAAAREAAKNNLDSPTIAGQPNSQRYLSDVSNDDQIWVNAEYGRFHNKIMNKCNGADHMGTGHRTEMITDLGMTGDEAVAEYHKRHPAQSQTSSAMKGCMKEVSGVHFRVMADLMEKKMNTLKLSTTERAEWQADIAAVRKSADAGGTIMPTVSGANPYRPLSRLVSPQEQLEMTNETNAQTKAGIARCQALKN